MTKVILATALVAQTGSRTKLSEMLYQSVEPCITACIFQHTTSHDLRTLLLLVAIYHFANEDLILGARSIMYAARTAVEQGLYRIETLTAKIADENERQAIICQLWSLFALDRQFNFAAGLPQHLNDSDVDLPPPVDAPYLDAMVKYVTMGAQAWNSLVNRNTLASGQAPSKENQNFFQYQILHWREELDPSVRFDIKAMESDDDTFLTSNEDECAIYLKTLLYLRSNQIQILVLRPILIYPQPARKNEALVIDAITLARKTIRLLNTLATRTRLYKNRQAIFNHFLSSSLAVLFLTAAYDAETQASRSAHADPQGTLLGDAVAELQTALDLIDRLRTTSQSAARLWSRFSRPRQQLVQLGILSSREVPQHHSSTNFLQLSSGGQHSKDSQPDGLIYGAGVSPVTNAAAEYQGLDIDPSVSFDFDPGDFETNNGFLWQDWFEGGFMDSSVPFGMPAWM